MTTARPGRRCLPRRRRPTLLDVATELGTHGPTVKREETLLLARLHTQLIEGDMTDSAVIWRPNFLSYFKAAKGLHDTVGNDYSHFCNLLGQKFGINSNEIANSVEGLWAVLSLYPGGRRVNLIRHRIAVLARSREKTSSPHSTPEGVVVLRGFRRPH